MHRGLESWMHTPIVAYQEIPYHNETIALPDQVAGFIEEADRRGDAFYQQQLNKRYPRYVPSEPAQIYAALKYVTDQRLPLGHSFIEWGSGFGVATGLAALLGYDATGIEIEAALVQMATTLLQDQKIEAELLCTSYIPEGYMSYETIGGSALTRDDSFGHTLEHPPCYAGMTQDIEEIDLFFVYPWPGEQEMMLQLFDATAGEGAILIAYYGDRDICLYRKTEPMDENDLY
ncbi:MAG: hypothetical protein ACI81V_001005 [Lentimonas sp.]